MIVPLRKCKCGTVALTWGDLGVFTPNSSCKFGRSNVCKVCRASYLSQYRKDNLKAISEYNTKYSKGNRDKANIHSAAYRGSAKGRAASARGTRKYRANKLKVCENYEYTEHTFKLFGNSCFNCGSTSKLCLDHHYPLSKGYKLTKSNAVILCNICNSSKGAKLPEDFYTEEQLNELKIKGIN